jgi:hypothetical protein
MGVQLQKFKDAVQSVLPMRTLEAFKAWLGYLDNFFYCASRKIYKLVETTSFIKFIIYIKK